MDYVAFWRFSTNDGLYNPALMLDYPSVNNERFIANQIGAIAGYEINKFISIELESNIIFPGAFLKQSNQGDPLYHFVFTTATNSFLQYSQIRTTSILLLII